MQEVHQLPVILIFFLFFFFLSALNLYGGAQAPQAVHVYSPFCLSVGVIVSTVNDTLVPYT